jgi:hypothetical protein
VEVLVFELPFNNKGEESPIALKTADFFKKIFSFYLAKLRVNL